MENIRAFTLVRKLGELADNIEYFPMGILENDSTTDVIKEDGLRSYLPP